MHITTITNHSELGAWTHSECVPAGLDGAIEKMRHFEGRMSLLRERSFPRVYSEIILQLGPRFREVDGQGNCGDYFPQACLGGATTAPSVIVAPDAVCCVIGLQLHAAAAYRLLRVKKCAGITISMTGPFLFRGANETLRTTRNPDKSAHQHSLDLLKTARRQPDPHR